MKTRRGHALTAVTKMFLAPIKRVRFLHGNRASLISSRSFLSSFKLFLFLSLFLLKHPVERQCTHFHFFWLLPFQWHRWLACTPIEVLNATVRDTITLPELPHTNCRTHRGQGPKYPVGTCWIHCDCCLSVITMYPLIKIWAHFKCLQLCDLNVSAGEILITFWMYSVL